MKTDYFFSQQLLRNWGDSNLSCDLKPFFPQQHTNKQQFLSISWKPILRSIEKGREILQNCLNFWVFARQMTWLLLLATLLRKRLAHKFSVPEWLATLKQSRLDKKSFKIHKELWSFFFPLYYVAASSVAEVSLLLSVSLTTPSIESGPIINCYNVQKSNFRLFRQLLWKF